VEYKSKTPPWDVLVKDKRSSYVNIDFPFRFWKVEKKYKFDPEPSPTRFGQGEEGLADLATRIRRGRGALGRLQATGSSP
jgi:hypothetical protein